MTHGLPELHCDYCFLSTEGSPLATVLVAKEKNTRMTLATPTTVTEALRGNVQNLPEKARATAAMSNQQGLKIEKDVQDQLFSEHGPLENDD